MPYEAALLLFLLSMLALVVGLDLIRADVAAMIALLGLAGLQQLPGVLAFVDIEELFAGFSSRTVIALIGVMIISEALVRCGFIYFMADGLLTLAQGSRFCLAIWLFSAVATVSMVIQNAGAAAMAVPLVSRVAKKLGLEKRQLLMPVSRMILMGGCCTLIGSSPLLMLNDLLPNESGGFELLAPLPVGVALVASGLLFSLWEFRRSLSEQVDKRPGRDVQLRSNYQLGEATRCYRWREGDNNLVSVKQLEDHFSVRVVAIYSDGLQLSPTRDVHLPPQGYIALMGANLNLNSFEAESGLVSTDECAPLEQALSADFSGLVEVVLTPGSSLVGQRIRDMRLRHYFGLTPLAIYRTDGVIDGDIRQQTLQAGDSLLAHISWQELDQIQSSDDFLVLAPDKPKSMAVTGLGTRTWGVLVCIGIYGVWAQPGVAFIMFAAAVSLTAVGVLDPERAYRAISWRTIFMLACLMPFSQAMTASGASEWLADGIMILLGSDANGFMVLLFFAVLAAALGQLVSNVAATVILVPVAIQVSELSGYELRGLVLLVGISVSNAFLLPTNQVTAVIASAGNYQAKDFLRSGLPQTFIFCAVSVAVVAAMYPSYLT